MILNQVNHGSPAENFERINKDNYNSEDNISSWQSSPGGVKVAIFLSVFMFLAPALGSFSDYVVQDTLKSIVISFGVLIGCLTFFMEGRTLGFKSMRWHVILLAPGLLVIYSVGCMAWSSAYYAAGSAVRWLMFGFLTWLIFCVFSKNRISTLALGIHAGAFFASVLAAMQFWLDIQFISQGPPPASTFFNRNFFAEYVVCTLPFSVFLIMRGGSISRLRLISFSSGINVLALMMAGTRSAQIALLAMIFFGGGFFIFVAKIRKNKYQITSGKLASVIILFLIPILFLGSIPTGNKKIIEDSAGTSVTPMGRYFQRSVSMLDAKEYTEKSFSVRSKIWRDTFKMIRSNPLFGVGAGAWNVHIPIYQNDDESIEVDYYAHNEFIQLVSEYGVVGWIFLMSLAFYWVRSFLESVKLAKELHDNDGDFTEVLIRLTSLTGLLMMAVVSAAGFPWHMAATTALFAVCLGVLMASDFRMGLGGISHTYILKWSVSRSNLAVGVFSVALLIAGYVTSQSLRAERKIINAVNLSLTITSYGDVGDKKWDELKREIVLSVKDSVAINSNDRFMIPRVADEFAKWGDWGSAIWIWKTILDSHPYLFGVITNVARGYLVMGDIASSNLYLDKVRKLRPNDPNVRVLDIVMLTKTQGNEQAKKRVNELLGSGVHDFEFLKIVYWLGSESKDFNMVLKSLDLMTNFYPENLVDASLEIGKIHTENVGFIDEHAALVAYRRALSAASATRKADVLKQIPLRLQAKL